MVVHAPRHSGRTVVRCAAACCPRRIPHVCEQLRFGARRLLLSGHKGGEFVRILVKRDGERYLIHLPVAP
jgi:hypothetical protein